MQQRCGRPPDEILKRDKDYDHAWNLEADYVAVGICNLVCTVSLRELF